MLWLITAVLLAQQPAGLIRNGGFDEGPGTPMFLNLAGRSTALPGWVVTGEGIDLVGAGYWRSSEGTYAIDLDGSARSRATPPVAPNSTAEGRQQNRRVEVRLRKDGGQAAPRSG